MAISTLILIAFSIFYVLPLVICLVFVNIGLSYEEDLTDVSFDGIPFSKWVVILLWNLYCLIPIKNIWMAVDLIKTIYFDKHDESDANS